ncbi:MAG: hypothetical protein IJK02_12340 [Clostridia bacterium]|nr:hypothetical protein [Clostridia bacterium]MBR0537019.1 hypothetical protein [Clostridia bacterium]
MENERKKPVAGVLWFTSLLLCMSLTLGIFTLAHKKKKFSENENRMLAAFPAFSFSAVANGKYFEDLNAYFADHFAGRDFWITLNLTYKQLLGQKENGGVYIGKNGNLFLQPSPVNGSALQKNLDAIDAFANAFPEADMYISVVPNAVTVCSQNLPANAPVPDQNALISRIADAVPAVGFIDVTDTLTEHRDEQIYYRTDHHWTSLGAKYASDTILKAMDAAIPGTDYEIYTVSDSFEGTLSSKCGKHSLRDKVELYVPKNDVRYTVTYTDSMKKTASIYEPDALNGKDHYTVFFGGNHPRIDIASTADAQRTLLVFKDSYANCLMQFLYSSFDEIVILDPRYYYESAAALMRQRTFTDVLFLYNADTFGTDTALADILSDDV